MTTARGRKARFLSIGIAAAVAVCTSGVMVYGASNAAFTASTQNPGNTWSTGAAPVLTDDDQNDTMMFNVSNLGPGDSDSRCIAVTSTTSSPTRDLRFYSFRSDAVDLATQLNITVERGTGGTFSTCSGFSSAGTLLNTPLASLPASWADAAATSVTVSSGTATTVYKISYSLPGNLSSTYASKTTVAKFMWEIH